jgi:trehalose 6-phosphate phosphatase
MAALHGLAVRGHDGSLRDPAGVAASIAPVRNAVAFFAETHSGTRMEDKGLSIALHYRGAPAAGPAAEELAMRLAGASDGLLRVQRGKMVVELLPAGTDKGTAIVALMRNAPFRSRRPVFVGDDVTDEAGFVAVNTLDGVTVRVGEGKSAARHQVPDVISLREWLARAVAS